jgi:5-methylcytosine-specific restriction endonuclease McrA
VNRKPIKRSDKPLKRTPLKNSSKKINNRSKKTEEKYKLRRPLVEKLLGERPWCEACPVFAQYDELAVYQQRPSSDVHELVRRSQGGSILDESNLMCVCRPCHTRIGNYPQLAFDLGLSKHSYDS